MKNLFIFLMLIVLSISAVICPASAAAVAGEGTVSSKEEVIYASLYADGRPEKLYAVNILNVSTGGKVEDHGKYLSLANLTDAGVLEYSGGTITAEAAAGRFYYQGDMAETSLPWKISISYLLGEKPVPAEELAGASGRMEIRISTAADPDADPALIKFYENYLLQVTLTLDTEKCTGIVGGATIANSGTDKLIVFTILPGTEGDISLSADITDFDMESIMISAIPFSSNYDIPDITGLTDGLALLTDAISQISIGASELSTGAATLLNGAETLAEGSAGFLTGLTAAGEGAKDLKSGSQAILDALDLFSAPAAGEQDNDPLSLLAQLPAALTQASAGLSGLSGGLALLPAEFAKARTALDAAIGSMPAAAVSDEEIASLLAADPENAALASLAEGYRASKAAIAAYTALSPALDTAAASLSAFSTSADTIAISLGALSAGLGGDPQVTEGGSSASLTAILPGIKAIAENYKVLHQGISDFADAVQAFSDGYTGINSGIESLSTGISGLSDGAGTLADGTSTLKEQSAGIPGMIDTMVSGLSSILSPADFSPRSFLSQENKNVLSVQFVMSTPGIKKLLEPAAEPLATEQESVWTRFLNLFGL